MHNILADNALIDLVVPRAEQREVVLEARIDLAVHVYMLRRSDITYYISKPRVLEST